MSQSMKDGAGTGARRTTAMIGAAALLIAAWYLLVWAFDLPRILLPRPDQVVAAAWYHRNELLHATLTTAFTAVSGLLSAVVVGFAVAVLFSQSRLLRFALFPYAVFLQTVPIVAIAPLLIIWSGYQFRTTVLATLIICLFPIINNVTTGLAAAPREYRDLFSLYGAGRFRQLIRLQIPTAVPYLVLGMRISSGLAVVGAIVAEFFVSNGADYVGLGAKIPYWQSFMKTDVLIAAVFCSSLLGLALFTVVQFVGHTLLGRWNTLAQV